VRDAVIDPQKAGNKTGAVRKGSRVLDERLVTAIVDEPGSGRSYAAACSAQSRYRRQ
jgi:hypothetical protein